jgi:hypothetical protein
MSAVPTSSLNRGKESITVARNGFNESRCVGAVGKYTSDLANAEVEALIEIHYQVIGPDFFTDLVAGDQIA